MFKKAAIRFSKAVFNSDVEKSYPLDSAVCVYHCVSNEPLPHLNALFPYKNEKEFEADLDFISRHFSFVTWEEYIQFLTGSLKTPKRPVLLTFDDGLREFYDIVIPILERKGIYAMNFINPKFIDNSDLMFRCKASLLADQAEKKKEKLKKVPVSYFRKRVLATPYQESYTLDNIAENIGVDFSEYLETEKPYLSSEQLKKIQEKGFGIASHGWDHPLYSDLNMEQQLENTMKAHHFMEKEGFITDAFAFPFTDFGVSHRFFEELNKTPDIPFYTFGSAGLKYDSIKTNLQRIPMENGKTAESVFSDETAYFKLKKKLGKNKIERK